MARVYSLKVSMTSGARYHLDKTKQSISLAVKPLTPVEGASDSPRGHVFCHEGARIVRIWRWPSRASEAEIADLQGHTMSDREWQRTPDAPHLEIAIRVEE
jgi:hypothetical protein